MTLKFPDELSLKDGVQQAIDEEQRQILSVIASESDVHAKIHEVRKSLKKLRAVVRLVRKSTDRYQEENIFYRDLGREISFLRDKTAHLEALHRLKDKYQDSLYIRTFSRFRKRLEGERQRAMNKAWKNHDPLSFIQKEIQTHQQTFKPFQVNTIDEIIPGLRKVYKRGRKGLERVNKSPTTENFHEWRKRTKYLRYQMEMLMAAFPHIISAFEESLHDLSDFLGNDHDMALLHERAFDYHESGFSGENEYQLLCALMAHERTTLQRSAVTLGQKLYLDDPDQFVRRIEKFWEIER